MPPTIVFKGVYHMEDWYTALGDEKVSFSVTQKGWTNNALGVEWARQFETFSRPPQSLNGPETRLLLFDGHESHVSVGFLDLCHANNIELLCMPAHSTHLLQPLDVGLFGPLQQRYAINVSEILFSMDYQVSLSKTQFYQAFRKAHDQTFTKQNILSAWRKSGYFPFNPNFIIRQCKEPSPSPIKMPITNVVKTPRTLVDIIDVKRRITAHGVSPTQNYLVNILAKSAELNATRCNLLEAQLKASQIANKEIKRRGNRRRLISGQNGGHLVTGADIQQMKADLEAKRQAELVKSHQPRRRGRPPKQPTRSVLAAVVIDSASTPNRRSARISSRVTFNDDISVILNSDEDSDTSPESSFNED